MKAYITPETDVLDLMIDKPVMQLLSTSETPYDPTKDQESRYEEEDIDADFWE